MGTHDTQASSDQSGATLRAPLANPPPESSDVSATLDVAEISEVEAYASPTLVEAAANVGAFTSPPVLDVEVSANVGTSTSLVIGQTTHITPGKSVRHASATVASGVPPGPHQSYVALAAPPPLAEAAEEELSIVSHAE